MATNTNTSTKTPTPTPTKAAAALMAIVTKNTKIRKVSDDFTVATFVFPDGYSVSVQEYNSLHPRRTIKSRLLSAVTERVQEASADHKLPTL